VVNPQGVVRYVLQILGLLTYLGGPAEGQDA